MAAASMQIGEVALKTGLSVDAIRFYERAGLVPKPARSSGGYRLYHDRQVADLEFIQKAQLLGFSLNEIRDLFSIQRQPEETCVHVRSLIEQKLGIARSKKRELERLEAELAAALRQCRRVQRQASQDSAACPVLKNIATSKVRGTKL
jgi:MerR family mercuric resistance operon transcriptional regulator